MSADPLTPPRKVYQLKSKQDFVRANPPILKGDQGKSPDHDVYAWRRDARAMDIAAGVEDLERPSTPPSNRRRRDY
ncbi:MAG: hypothetical protein J6386_15175 [Candidatus Synoicihabitans palmerolidicus]|nr:hypothetical protein [Candidatus Synoicihabitans palmerolidicus]